MALNIKKYKEQQDRMANQGQFGRLSEGKNVLRIFTFTHKVGKEDFARKLYDKDGTAAAKVGETHEELSLKTLVHFPSEGGPPVACTETSSCSLCREARRLSASNSKTDKKEAKKVGRRTQFIVNAVNMAEPTKMMAMTLPQSVYNDVLGYLTSDEYDAEALFGINGRDFIITRDKTKPPAQMYEVQLRDSEKCKALPKSMLDGVIDLYSTGFSATQNTADEEEKEVDVDTDDEEEVEVEEEVEEKPKAKPKATKEDVLEDEDEEEAPAKSGAKGGGKNNVGRKVFFLEGGKKYRGKVKSEKNGVFEVDTGDEIWKLDASEFRFDD